MLEIKAKSVGGITVLDLSGTLVVGSGLDALSQRVKQLIVQQRPNVVVNAKEVAMIDSSGVSDLVASFSLCKKNGGSLKVAAPRKLVRDVLHIARIPTVIEIYDTEEAALKAFEKPVG